VQHAVSKKKKKKKWNKSRLNDNLRMVR